MLEILNQYAGALQAVVAIAALVVSVVAIRNSNRALRMQREHSVKSMRPDLAIIISDYNDKIRIQVKNNGLGPGRITKQCFYKDGKAQEVDKLVDLMPTLTGPYWTHFSSSIEDLVLGPGSMRNLIEFSGQVALDHPEIVQDIRVALASLKLSFDYVDYYDNSYNVEKELNWYARYLDGPLKPTGKAT